MPLFIEINFRTRIEILERFSILETKKFTFTKNYAWKVYEKMNEQENEIHITIL